MRDPGLPDGLDKSTAAPAIGELGAAAEHLAAADLAVTQHAYDAAVRERYRAVVRGLEQRGVLETERARTARQTALDAARQDPGAGGLLPAAQVFDEVVYGRRPANADDYQSVAQADNFSDAPPPRMPKPSRKAGRAAKLRSRRWRAIPVSPKVWLALAGLVLLAALILLLPSSCSAPSMPDLRPQRPELRAPEIRQPDPDARKSLFETLPPPVAFGGAQLAVAAVVLLWWRARRRGALVPEPRLVEVPAHEVVAGQARLYWRSRDHAHVAGRLRAATLRRIRPALGILPAAAPDTVVAALASQGVAPGLAGHALYGPVEDADMLEQVAAELELIEAEVSSR